MSIPPKSLDDQRRRLFFACAAVFILAVGFRLLALVEMRDGDVATVLLGDGRQYDLWAREIEQGDWIGKGIFYQAPLYPYFLGSIYTLFGRSLIAVRMVQILIGSTGCCAVVVAGEAFFCLRIGMTAGVLLALYPPAVFFDLVVQKTVLDAALLSSLVALLGEYQRRPRHSLLWIAGANLGVLSLSRENAAALVVVIVPWLAIHFHRRWTFDLLRAGIFAAAMLAAMSPVAIRNKLVGGGLALSTSQLGPNLFIGNGPLADGRYVPLIAGRGDARHERDDAVRLAQADAGRALSPGEVSRYWLTRTINHIRSEPLDWLKLLAWKSLLACNASEVADTECIEIVGDQSAVIGWPRPWFHFGVLFPVALAGVVVTAQDWRRLWILYGVIVVFLMSVVFFYVLARYREPIVPVLAIFAGAGVVGMIDAIARRRWRTVVAGSIAVALGALISNRPIDFSREHRAVHSYALGKALLEQGRDAAAEPWLADAVVLLPQMGAARTNLAVAMIRQKKYEPAQKLLWEQRRLEPTSIDPLNNLGAMALLQGRNEEAIEYFQTADRLEANRKDVLSNLGAAYLHAKKYAEAAKSFQRIVDLDPNDSAARTRLAEARRREGRSEEAVRELQQALRIDPRNMDARRALEAIQRSGRP